MHRRGGLNPKVDATFDIDTGGDNVGLDIKYMNAFKALRTRNQLFHKSQRNRLWNVARRLLPPRKTCLNTRCTILLCEQLLSDGEVLTAGSWHTMEVDEERQV
ncbi:hypothetical protein EYF80_051753 [Liparis tanakae]|uniref:Uncharacterized protein n=1 Tax=Liparis tanakae TaxID=230148 RepID=A0A4Z2FAX6_9TELE|nr:hypothetical protein EYF80_051753 [Liparis tanakae]